MRQPLNLSLDQTVSVGDRVRVRTGPAPMPAEIIEDRERFGLAETRVYRVRLIDASQADPASFEVWAEDITPETDTLQAGRS